MRSNPFLPRGNVERTNLVIGTGFLTFGAFWIAMSVLSMSAEDRSFGLIAGIIGLLLAAIGAAIIIVPTARRRKRERIRRLGISVAATVTDIRHENDESSFWIVVAEVADKNVGKEGVFTSHAFANDPRTNRYWVNPRNDYPIGSEITIYYLPEDQCTYAFDLMDRLDGPRQRPTPMPVAVREAWIRDNYEQFCSDQLLDEPDVSATLKSMLHRDHFTLVEIDASTVELPDSSFKVVLRCEANTEPEVEGAYALTETRWTLLFGEPSEWETLLNEVDSH